MLMPLYQYHSGGDEAVFEPLQDHLTSYSFGLGQYFGGGVSACYRGTRLYDNDATRAVVKQWVKFYKDHRQILNGDIVHVARPTMQDIDSWLHVDPMGEERGLLLVFNPTGERIKRDLQVDLYYTGLVKVAHISHEGAEMESHMLSRDYKITLKIDLDPLSITWYLIK